MPLRSYRCECGEEYQKLLQPSDPKERECPKCGKLNEPQLPSTVNARVYEMRDKYRGKQLMKNNDRLQKKRMQDHHDKYEVFEKIDKYGLDDAKRYGWLKKAKKS